MDYRLVYHSSNRITLAPEQRLAEIEQILAASRRNNVLVGVTGALMFSSGFFAQVLEGAPAAVEATFERIQNDRRHGAVTVLEFASIDQRTFPQWSMAYVGRPAEGQADFGAIAQGSGFDPASLTGHQLLLKLRDRLLAETVAAA